MSVVIQVSSDQVVIGVDPHKGSWTAAAVDASLQPLASIRVPVSREGYRALRGFARRWTDARWAVEGATGVGAPQTRRLRRRHRGHRRARQAGHPGTGAVDRARPQNDDADAVSVGITALTTPTLNTAHTAAWPGRQDPPTLTLLGGVSESCHPWAICR
jgi:transposase